MAFTTLNRRATALLWTGILLSLASTPAFAADERCSQLVALHKQYAGVGLTSEQKDIKVQLVSWYRENCGRVRHSVSR